MQIGTDNEDITSRRFKSLPYVKSFYKCGLLISRNRQYIGVSPDGIAEIKLQDTDVVICAVEIKTRVVENTIGKAIEDNGTFGGLVQCLYGDDRFKKCVPSENRLQLLHQAMVLGTSHGVFVTSIVENGEGCITQVVIFRLSEEVKQNHFSAITKVDDLLIGWMWNQELFNQDYLTANFCPKWLTMTQKNVIKSRFRLWIAHNKYIEDESDGFCPRPTKMYKHSSQFTYNKGKGGLDMSSECEQKVRTKDKLCFKRKYMNRMIDAVTTNGWRLEQARTVLLPYIKRLQNKGKKVTLEKLRLKISRSCPLEDYVMKTSVELLQHLSRPSNDEYNKNVTNNVNDIEKRVHSIITNFEMKFAPWPIKRNRFKYFNNELTRLPELRMTRSYLVNHSRVIIPRKGYTDTRGICPLCLNGNLKIKTQYQCVICKVPLCTTIPIKRATLFNYQRNGSTCFDFWHSAKDMCLNTLNRKRLPNDDYVSVYPKLSTKNSPQHSLNHNSLICHSVNEKVSSQLSSHDNDRNSNPLSPPSITRLTANQDHITLIPMSRNTNLVESSIDTTPSASEDTQHIETPSTHNEVINLVENENTVVEFSIDTTPSVSKDTQHI